MGSSAFLRRFFTLLKENILSVAGLSLGMMITVFSVTYIVFESSYDRFHKNSERICLVSTLIEIESGNEVVMSSSHHNMKDYIDSHVPQVEMACRIRDSTDPLIIDDVEFRNQKGLFVDEDFFSIFKFGMLLGEGSVLEDPGSIILTRDLAEKLYGDINCLGENLQINDNIYTVRGVAETPPGNTSIRFEYLIPMSVFLGTLESYSSISVETYILTPVAYDDYTSVSESINGFYEAYDVKGKDRYKVSISKLTDQYQYYYKTSKNFILFATISILALLVSVVNFINAFAAGSELRIRDTGIRKAMGATRVMLMRDMLLTSVIISLISALFGLILSEIFIGTFRELSGVDVRQYGPGLWKIQVSVLLIAVFTGLLAGAFPAIRYSSPNVLAMITGRGLFRNRSFTLRKVLVLVQYIISGGLLISLFIFFYQIRYLNNKYPGFDVESRMLVRVSGDLEFKYAAYISELEKIPGIISVSGNGSEFGGTVGFGFKRINSEEGMPAMGYFVEDGFFRTYGIKLIRGKTFEETSGRDSSKVLIDASTSEILGYNDPVGERFILSGREVEIIGLVEDADLIALKGEREPFVYTQFYDLCAELIVNYEGDPSVIADRIAEKMTEFDPDFEYNYRMLEEARGELYKKEANQVKIVLLVGLVAVLMTIVGAYSLASYMAERRAKQVSIRKVMGATVAEVIQLSVKEMTWMIIIAFIIASPLAYFVSIKWLQNFTQKISIGPLPFILALVVLSVLILITVYFKERKAALANPVKHLRQE